MKKNFSDCKKGAEDLGIPANCIEALKNKNFYAFCDKMVTSLAELQTNDISSNKAFDIIESSLRNDIQESQTDSKFISILAKYIAMSLSKNIEIKNLSSFTEKLDDAIKRSQLSENDISYCKKLLQTAVCSYVFWNIQDN